MGFTHKVGPEPLQRNLWQLFFCRNLIIVSPPILCEICLVAQGKICEDMRLWFALSDQTHRFLFSLYLKCVFIFALHLAS